MTMHSSDRQILEGIAANIANLSARVDSIEERLHSMDEKHTKIADIVDEIKPEIVGLVERLQQNPMFKMLLGGK